MTYGYGLFGAYPNPVFEPDLGYYVITVHFIPTQDSDAQNKKDTGKLLGYISYAIHGVTGLFSIEKAEQWSAKDIVRAVRKAWL